MNPQRKFCFHALVLLSVCLFGQTIFGQTIVRRQDFDGNNTWNYNLTGTSNLSGTGLIGATAAPANSTFGAASATNTTQIRNNDATSQGFGTQNGTSVFTFENIPPSAFTGNVDLYMSFRFAGIAANGANGIDSNDNLTVLVSLDNGAFSQEALIEGGAGANNNAFWNYNSNGERSVAFDGNGTIEAAKNFIITTQNNGADSFSKFTIRIPDGVLNTLTTGVRLRVNLGNNNANEIWLVDDFIAYTNIVTAAPVSVSGRVTDANGVGLARAVVAATGADGLTRQALTNPFGYFKIDDLRAGENYLIEVRNKQYNFAPRLFAAADSLENFDLSPQTESKSNR